MILVIGGSGSGKSEFAEQLVTDMTAERGLKPYYLATMKVYGEEEKAKIEKHRHMRAGKGFETLEQAADVFLAVNKIDSPERSAVLLECVSNLTANEMFGGGINASPNEAAAKVTCDIDTLNKRCGELVVVADDVFEDGLNYDPAVKSYAEALGKINCALARESDEVFEVVAGIPVRIK